MQDLEFYQSHLDRVSRSFAFCIRKLDPPFRTWVSISYLLCRSVDTVEDALWESSAIRDLQFTEFESFVICPSSFSKIREWVGRFPESITEGEKQLLADSLILFSDFHELPSKVKSEIRSTVLRMCAGMRHYASKRNQQGHLKLPHLREVNRYCYFVAGIVGELLTHLLLSYRTEFSPPSDLMKNAFHFGLFLQKINLLKDQKEDEKEGRFLIPHRNLVFASLRKNAQGALNYLVSVPQNEKGYRTFCAWALFVGLVSMPWIYESFEQGSSPKIPRSMTEVLLQSVESMIQDDAALLRYGAECLRFLDLFTQEPLPLKLEESESWFHQISGGVLSLSELIELGICENISRQSPSSLQSLRQTRASG